MDQKEHEKKEGAARRRTSQFRVALLVILFLIVIIRLVDIFVYPETEILPLGVILGVVMIQLFLLWLDSAKEKQHILWLQKEKEKLGSMKSKFLVMTSHELMTPITVIKSYLEMLSTKMLGEVTPQQEEAFGIMSKYTTRLEKIQDTLAKMESGEASGLKKQMEETSIETIVRSTANDLLPFVKKRNQHLEVRVEENLPSLTLEKNGIRQVIANLLLNAIRFTPDDGKITVRAERAGDNVRVEIEDNGIGIPEDKLGSIFESFYEVQDSATGHSSGTIEFKSGGMGLGLSIAKSIIETHKGKIWVESEENKFSRFIFTLPK
jgi:signal transduction histidine kinase